MCLTEKCKHHLSKAKEVRDSFPCLAPGIRITHFKTMLLKDSLEKGQKSKQLNLISEREKNQFPKLWRHSFIATRHSHQRFTGLCGLLIKSRKHTGLHSYSYSTVLFPWLEGRTMRRSTAILFLPHTSSAGPDTPRFKGSPVPPTALFFSVEEH